MDKIRIPYQEQWMLVWEAVDSTLDANASVCLSDANDRGKLRRDILDAIAEHVSFANYEENDRG